MAIIKIKRGQSANVKNLSLETGELAVTLDTKELYVGDSNHKPMKVGQTINNLKDGENNSLYQSSCSSSYTIEGETISLGQNSIELGDNTIAEGNNSMAIGQETWAKGINSTAEGLQSVASGENQHVEGKFNLQDNNSKYAHILGIGSLSTRANGYTVDWNGNAWYAGKVLIGGTSQDDGKELSTKEYVDDKIGDINTILATLTAPSEVSE